METMQFDDLDNALLSLMAQLRERMVARTDLSTSMEGQIAYAVVRAIQISPDIAPNDKLAAVNYVSKVLVEMISEIKKSYDDRRRPKLRLVH